MQAVLAKAGLVYLHQTHLANGCGGLQIMNCRRPLLPAKPLHAFGNRAAGYEHDRFALLLEMDNLLYPLADRVMIQSRAFVGKKAAAYFYDKSFCLRDNGGHGY
jgi:hypothetical protein